MKKSFKLTLTACAILMACAACETNGGSTPVESTPVESTPVVKNELTFDTTKQVSITFYHTMNQYLKEILDYNIEQFNKIYPNIVVTNVSAGDYDGVEDQIVTSISAGEVVADMAYFYPDHVALYNKA